MKIEIKEKLKEAALITGGLTEEVRVDGSVVTWTHTTDSDVVKALGCVFEDNRDALYIPTLQKDGHPVSDEVVEWWKGRARGLGFTETTSARGMWVLSETGEIQSESIWILWTNRASEEVLAQMAELAEEIKTTCSQDSVAWEQNGELMFTECG